MADSESLLSSIPSYFYELPAIVDSLDTETSRLQDDTLKECLPLLRALADPSRNPFDFNAFGIPALEREDHVSFLHDNLEEFPAPFVGIDASRPWMVYWALSALYMLGEDVTSFRLRVVKTFYTAQNKTGGFGGGYGHYSHLAGTYAAILSLALVGGEEAYTLIDRGAMWHWLGRLKQPDGGFRVTEGGEEDVRGAYCALVAISLLDLPLALPPESPAREAGMETFFDGLGEYLSRCQTYEGGIGSSPGSEAHGAYAFCVVACLCLYDAPHRAISNYLDIDSLLWWLSTRQYGPEGGLAGRTNKLVDGCYSGWLGGCWPLVQAALSGPKQSNLKSDAAVRQNLYSSEGLARYILSCCQGQHGGLRDKPSKRPDSYHTCYTLIGVSTVEHLHTYTDEGLTDPFSSAFSWAATGAQIPSERDGDTLFETGANLRAVHPVFMIPHEAVDQMRQWSRSHPLDHERLVQKPDES